jgi:multiple sugar transport system substrate-binding protein
MLNGSLGQERILVSLLNRLQHWLLIGLLSISLFGLAGCQPFADANSDVIHLTLWQGVNPPPNRDVLQKLVDRFNQEHPNIQVESLYVGQADQQLPKILAAVVGNAPPDLLWFPPMITGQLVELNAIQPLEQWLNGSPVRSQIDPALFDSMQFEEHLWSVPFGTNNVGIFYRPSLFQAAGIEPPKTWAELRQAARTLTRDTNGDGQIDQHGILLSLGKSEWVVFTWLPFLWSGGGELGNREPDIPQERKVDIESPGAIAALQLWRDLIDDGSAILSAPERGYELDNFLAGKVAMQLTGPWTLGQLQTTGVDFGVMPIPVAEKPATASGGENLFIMRTNPDREKAAFTFAEYVVSEAFQTEWALGTGYLPVNLNARKSATYQKFVEQQPVLKVFLDQTQYGRSRPIFPGYSRVSEQLGRAIESVLLQRATPEAALQESQLRLNLIF